MKYLLDSNNYKKISIEIMKLQQNSGFMKTVIGSTEEDIWNDLI